VDVNAAHPELAKYPLQDPAQAANSINIRQRLEHQNVALAPGHDQLSLGLAPGFGRRVGLRVGLRFTGFDLGIGSDPLPGIQNHRTNAWEVRGPSWIGAASQRRPF
jgi:hypothetical protein